MKYTNLAHTPFFKELYKNSCYVKSPLNIKMPFSETDIIDLQELFLTNGLHYISVCDVKTGRSIINMFLQSLNYYHDIACLTMVDEPFEQHVFDLYQEMTLRFCLEPSSQYDIEDFLIEYFYCDFMWVEATQGLIEAPWFSTVEQIIASFKLDKHIPIFILSYT